MEFEEIKKIWDSQNKQPMYVIDEKTLHRSVTRKFQASRRSVNAMEIGLVLINSFVITFLIVKGINNDYNIFQFLIAGAALLVTIYVILGRTRRRRRQSFQDRSLLSELDHAISNRDYLIQRGRTFIYWYMLPFATATLVSMYFNAKSPWIWILIVSLFALGSWLPFWEVQNIHLPKKRELESLKKTLTAQE